VTTDTRITSRPSEGDRDLVRMYDLAVASPGDALHVADLPWRLSSASAGVPERTRLWEDTGGGLVAWAALLFAWHCLDYATRLDARAVELEAEADGRDGRLPFYVSARERDVARIGEIETGRFCP